MPETAESPLPTFTGKARLDKPLVLLFYDGYEWRARPGIIRGTAALSRRLARFVYRSVRRKQVRTGFYTAFLALRRALEEFGCEVRVNDFSTARKMPHYPIGLAGYPSAIEAVKLPNPIIFGPGDYGAPNEAVAVAALPNMRILLQPSDWFRDYYRDSCGEKVATWFAGIDLNKWTPSSSPNKSIDVLIYDKIRWHRETRVSEVVGRLTAILEKKKLTYRIIRYGHHHQADFAQKLEESRSLAFICEHETQGIAYQEALAADVPVFAWDEGEFVDPQLRAAAPAEIEVSSVPYFSSQCGIRFKIEEIEEKFEEFWRQREFFRPREYVANNLNLDLSAKAYLSYYCSLIPHGNAELGCDRKA